MKFVLNQEVKIEVSGEAGTVIGRAEYTNGEPNYCVRYVRADRVATEEWWRESALVAA